VLAEAYTFGFLTPRPEVQAVDPEDKWRWVKPDQVFAIVMNQAVEDLAGHLRLAAGGQEPGRSR